MKYYYHRTQLYSYRLLQNSRRSLSSVTAGAITTVRGGAGHRRHELATAALTRTVVDIEATKNNVVKYHRTKDGRYPISLVSSSVSTLAAAPASR